jgi:hypothetical protein
MRNPTLKSPSASGFRLARLGLVPISKTWAISNYCARGFMMTHVEYQWPDVGVYESNIISHKVFGGEPSSLTFTNLELPPGCSCLNQRSITLTPLNGVAPPAPREHPFPHGWARTIRLHGIRFSVTFAVPTRTALLLIGRADALSNLRVSAKCR